MSDLSPLPGVKRKSHFKVVRSAFDPKATSDAPQKIWLNRPQRLPSDGFGQLNCPHPKPWGVHEAAGFYRVYWRWGRDMADASACPAT
jgi:hypothetical protein